MDRAGGADDDGAPVLHQEQRHAAFKHTTDLNDYVTRRRDQSASVRKEAKERLLSAKRQRPSDTAVSVCSEAELAAIVAGLRSPTFLTRLRQLRDILSSEQPPYEAVLSLGALEPLVAALAGDHAEAQLEAAWCLTNLAAGPSVVARAVLHAAGAYLVTLLSSGNPVLQEQVAWCVGNLAGDSDENRAALLQLRAVTPLVNLLRTAPHPGLQRTVAFALGQLQRRSSADHLIHAGAVPLLLPLLRSADPDVVADAAWVFPPLSAGDMHHKVYLLKQGVVGAMVPLLGAAPHISISAVRTLGNLVAASPELADQCLQHADMVPQLAQLLFSPVNAVGKEAAWVLANVAAGVRAHIDALVAAGVVDRAVQRLPGAPFDLKRELAYLLLNVSRDPRYTERVAVSPGVLPEMVRLLQCPDLDLVRAVLDWVARLLRHVPNAQAAFEAAGGLEALQALSMGSNDDARRAADDLLDQYYDEDGADAGTGAAGVGYADEASRM